MTIQTAQGRGPSLLVLDDVAALCGPLAPDAAVERGVAAELMACVGRLGAGQYPGLVVVFTATTTQPAALATEVCGPARGCVAVPLAAPSPSQRWLLMQALVAKSAGGRTALACQSDVEALRGVCDGLHGAVAADLVLLCSAAARVISFCVVRGGGMKMVFLSVCVYVFVVCVRVYMRLP